MFLSDHEIIKHLAYFFKDTCANVKEKQLALSGIVIFMKSEMGQGKIALK